MFDVISFDSESPRLGDLEPTVHELGVSCAHCLRTVTFAVAAWRRRYGRDTRPAEITRRMRCTDCRRKRLTPSIRLR
jgi:hypothetical protein